MERLGPAGSAVGLGRHRCSRRRSSCNRVEPARRVELRLTPYQGVVLPLPLSRHELGKRGLGPASSWVKARRLPDYPIPGQSPRQDSNLRPSAYKATALANLSYRGIVRSTGFEPAQPLRTTSTSNWRVYRSATNASSLWTVSNRLPPRTKGTLCQLSYRGTSCPSWPRTRNLRNQNPALCPF